MPIKGFVEFVSASQVAGWAFDTDDPATPVHIVASIGDHVCASGPAYRPRNDLAASGMGDGHQGGFLLDLDLRDVPDAVPEQLEVSALSGAATVRLAAIDKMPKPRAFGNRVLQLESSPEQPLSDVSQFPVFILGPARSGTSAMALALLGSERYQGCGEGHLFPLLHLSLSAVDEYYAWRTGQKDSLLARVPAAAFQGMARRAFVQLARDLFPTPYWIDKTPTVEMVRAAPLMRELWPNARFVFMKRRVVENALSRKRKFPHEPAASHYSDWAAVMTMWLGVREQLGESALEVEHRELVLDPSAVSASIADFLAMPEPAATRFRDLLTSSRPEQTDERFGAVHSIDELGLTLDEAQRMVEACAPLMEAFGYSYDESYYIAIRDSNQSNRSGRPGASA